MNATLVSALLRQRLASPLRVFVLLALWLPGLAAAAVVPSFGAVAGGGWWFAIVLAAGAIGQDVSSGVLHLTFARPVTRTSYVLSRWFAAAAGAFVFALVRLVAAYALMTLRGAMPGPLELCGAAIEDACMAAVGAATVVCFSALVDGLGDVAILALSFLGLQFAHTITGAKGWDAADRVLLELLHTLKPDLTLLWISHRGVQDWSPYVTVASTVTLALALAIVAINRRELSYADD